MRPPSFMGRGGETPQAAEPSHRVAGRKWRHPWLCPSVALGILALLASPARAEFQVCNQTLDVVNLAIGQDVDAAFQTEGWWSIGANQCVDVIREELKNRYVYLHATDVFGQAILNGTVEMCVDRRRFTIRGTDSCWERGHISAKFLEVDTLEQIRWTFFLTGVATGGQP